MTPSEAGLAHAAPSRADADEIEAVRAPATSALVVDQIRRAIATGRFAPGDRLPSERELSKQLAVSRNTLRAASRVLVAEGVIEVRRGAAGGIRVARTTPQVDTTREAARAVGEIAAALDLRSALESGAAHFAAIRRSADDLVRLRDAFDRMQRIFDEQQFQEVSEFWSADRAFHRAIGDAAHNERLARAIEDARIDFLRPLGLVFMTIEEHAHQGHDLILQAIEAGDPAAASAAARDHIERTRSAVLTMADPAAANDA